jgi:DNA-binding response OmpR family regulator
MGVKGAKTDPVHILVVEDSREDFGLIVRELRQGGLRFSSKCVDKYGELVLELNARPPSVVLCDHGVAQLDSLSVLDVVRARHPAMPFIVVSGSLAARQTAAVLERGADDCVPKDRLRELGHAVRRALRLGDLRRLLGEAETERDRLRMELEGWHASALAGPTMLPICAGCKKIRTADSEWQQLEFFFHERFNIRFSHGLCPDCVKQYLSGAV